MSSLSNNINSKNKNINKGGSYMDMADLAKKAGDLAKKDVGFGAYTKMGMKDRTQIDKIDTKSDFKKDIEEKGIFSAVLNVNFPWYEAIYNQPCFKLPSEVKDGLSETGYTAGPIPFQHAKKFIDLFGTNEQASVLSKTVKGIIQEILSFFIFNPFFYWYTKENNSEEEKYSWGHTNSIKMLVLKNFITKIFFCMFKIFGSPFIILYYALVLFYAFMLSLKLDHIGSSIYASLRFIPLPGLFQGQFFVPFKDKYNFNKETQKIELSDNSQDKLYGLGDSLIYLIGTVVPYQILIGPAWAKTYGEGGITALILIFTIISAVIIILGGFNILVVICVFLIYFYKVITGLAKASTEK